MIAQTSPNTGTWSSTGSTWDDSSATNETRSYTSDRICVNSTPTASRKIQLPDYERLLALIRYWDHREDSIVFPSPNISPPKQCVVQTRFTNPRRYGRENIGITNFRREK
jgi:hypothetical protein